MLSKVATKLTNRLLLSGVISAEEEEIYIYGFELLLSFLFSTAVILAIGIAVQAVLPTIAFLAVFIVLRSYTGGFHARTYAVCSLVTFSVYGVVMLLSHFLTVGYIEYLVMGVIGVALLIIFAPVKHPNKELTAQDIKRNKIISVVVFILFLSAGVMLCLANMYIESASIYFALIADLLLLFVKNRRKETESNEDC